MSLWLCLHWKAHSCSNPLPGLTHSTRREVVPMASTLSLQECCPLRMTQAGTGPPAEKEAVEQRGARMAHGGGGEGRKSKCRPYEVGVSGPLLTSLPPNCCYYRLFFTDVNSEAQRGQNRKHALIKQEVGFEPHSKAISRRAGSQLFCSVLYLCTQTRPGAKALHDKDQWDK